MPGLSVYWGDMRVWRRWWDIRKGVTNCNTDFTVYKFHCSFSSKQYIGSNITDFRYPLNNYKSEFRKVSKSAKPPKVNQEHFYQQFKLHEHHGLDDWRVTLIDRADHRKELRRRESFWHKLNIFFFYNTVYTKLKTNVKRNMHQCPEENILCVSGKN